METWRYRGFRPQRGRREPNCSSTLSAPESILRLLGLEPQRILIVDGGYREVALFAPVFLWYWRLQISKSIYGRKKILKNHRPGQ